MPSIFLEKPAVLHPTPSMKTKSTFTSGIHIEHLPAEILGNIFCFYQQATLRKNSRAFKKLSLRGTGSDVDPWKNHPYATHELLPIRMVCSRWNVIAINDSRLWKGFYLYKRVEIPRELNNAFSAFMDACSRSRGANYSLEVGIGGLIGLECIEDSVATCRRDEDFARQGVEVLNRVRSLHLTGNGATMSSTLSLPFRLLRAKLNDERVWQTNTMWTGLETLHLTWDERHLSKTIATIPLIPSLRRLVISCTNEARNGNVVFKYPFSQSEKRTWRDVDVFNRSDTFMFSFFRNPKRDWKEFCSRIEAMVQIKELELNTVYTKSSLADCTLAETGWCTRTISHILRSFSRASSREESFSIAENPSSRLTNYQFLTTLILRLDLLQGQFNDADTTPQPLIWNIGSGNSVHALREGDVYFMPNLLELKLQTLWGEEVPSNNYDERTPDEVAYFASHFEEEFQSLRRKNRNIDSIFATFYFPKLQSLSVIGSYGTTVNAFAILWMMYKREDYEDYNQLFDQHATGPDVNAETFRKVFPTNQTLKKLSLHNVTIRYTCIGKIDTSPVYEGNTVGLHCLPPVHGLTLLLDRLETLEVFKYYNMTPSDFLPPVNPLTLDPTWLLQDNGPVDYEGIPLLAWGKCHVLGSLKELAYRDGSDSESPSLVGDYIDSRNSEHRSCSCTRLETYTLEYEGEDVVDIKDFEDLQSF